MLLEELLTAFIEDEPLSVMLRGLFEHALSIEDVNAIFETSAIDQYTRTLTFDTVIELMRKVVFRQKPSVRAAYNSNDTPIPVSLTAVYDKLQGISPATNAALFEHIVSRLRTVIAELNATKPPLIPNYHTRILDGNALAATDHRLSVLRDTRSGPLPGKSLVVYDPEHDLAVHLLQTEDGHAQERALSDEILRLVGAEQCWIADANFCTVKLLSGIIQRQAAFIMRQHGSFPWTASAELRRVGESESGTVLEEPITFRGEDGTLHHLRRIVLFLKEPTRDGARQIAILTNLPENISALRIAELYEQRWMIESFFARLTTVLRCEINTLGYPKSSLFAFTIALIAANLFAAVRAAIRAVHGAEKEAQLSTFSLVGEFLSGSQLVLLRVLPLIAAQVVSVTGLVELLLRCARHVRIDKHRKSPTRKRGKVPQGKRGTPQDPPHVATARLLKQAKLPLSP